MTAVFLLALIWVFVLGRRVRAQTALIRQKLHREAILEERGRIARDIHDELGSSLTRITMLGERAEEDLAKREEVGGHLRKIVASARGTVQSLEEIVWAVNPENDTLDGLVGFISHYADQFFESANVHCRLEMPVAFSGHAAGGIASQPVPGSERGAEQRPQTFPCHRGARARG